MFDHGDIETVLKPPREPVLILRLLVLVFAAAMALLALHWMGLIGNVPVPNPTGLEKTLPAARPGLM